MDVKSSQIKTLRRALRYIRSHYHSEALCVDSLARHSGTSRRVLERLFRQLVNLSPHEAIIRRRIQVAKSALIQTDQPITEIASDVGFADVKSLRHHFRKLNAMSPGQWRQRQREQLHQKTQNSLSPPDGK